ncbi:hypothetical protein F2P56_001949 [Juglans regia]|uniref:GPI-anchored protein LLG1-like n=2 Tax=Juglans regia TaxID=51240 RepID=A0A2I4FKD5_JUGRE|nr:GPI-anchored protein LLG1-like [Juglans regia]KAF5481282.1 hypothetical protein F2P56_001949 [Juglans regia]
MASLNHFLCFSLFSFFLLSSLASSSTFLSNELLEFHGSTGRALLQTKKSCSVNFESQNYTILTSRCKGPQYTPEACCGAFKDFACPFADAINDLTTDCASTMFSYINLYGKYPPGLFANLCREGQLGLNCTNVEEPKGKSNRGQMAATQSTLVMITACLLILFFHWF